MRSVLSFMSCVNVVGGSIFLRGGGNTFSIFRGAFGLSCGVGGYGL
jgi:hypothetical protein